MAQVDDSIKTPIQTLLGGFCLLSGKLIMLVIGTFFAYFYANAQQTDLYSHSTSLNYLNSNLLLKSDFQFEQTETLLILGQEPDVIAQQKYNDDLSKVYYFQFDTDSCHINPFKSTSRTSEARKKLAACLQNQIWQNDSIPYWMKITGAATIVGTAVGTGKEDDLKLRIGFDKMDLMLRRWFSEN